MTDLPPPQSAPDGWYPDPHRPGMERWWDGQEWQERWQPASGPRPGYQTPPAGAYGAAYDPQAKSKLAAGLLGILLGGLGIHSFYLGDTSKGVIQIVVTIVTCGLGYIWGFVEGILILSESPNYRTDASGRPLGP